MSILLHPEKGVNARLTFCTQCGGDGEDLILLGRNETKYTCPECGCLHYGRPDKRKCGRCGHDFHRGDWKREKIGDMEKLPASRPCADCRAKNEECAEVVKAGGIYWQCEDCGSTGAIRAGSELAKEVRKTMEIEPPAPCGVKFTKKDCPVCTGMVPESEETAEEVTS